MGVLFIGGLVAVRCASRDNFLLPLTPEQLNKADESPHLRLGHVDKCRGPYRRHADYV